MERAARKNNRRLIGAPPRPSSPRQDVNNLSPENVRGRRRERGDGGVGPSCSREGAARVHDARRHPLLVLRLRCCWVVGRWRRAGSGRHTSRLNLFFADQTNTKCCPFLRGINYFFSRQIVWFTKARRYKICSFWEVDPAATERLTSSPLFAASRHTLRDLVAHLVFQQPPLEPGAAAAAPPRGRQAPARKALT